MIVMFSSLQSLQMIAMEPEQRQIPLSTISNDSLTALYKMDSALRFYIPGIKETDNRDTLKKILNSNGFCTIKRFVMIPDWSNPVYVGENWSDEDWQENYYRLIHGVGSPEEADALRQIKEQLAAGTFDMGNADQLSILLDFKSYEKNKRSLDELSRLLKDAKSVLKSFVPLKNWNPDNFIQKSSRLNRLFTYAKFQRIIKEKNLTHIRLPIKFLCIKNVQSGEYVTRENAMAIIDDALKICLHQDSSFSILFVSEKYRIEIFATKEKSEGEGLSKATMAELFILCNQAPFDIGDDNIFWDAKGDAIIIDTEYKGETTGVCGKLKRYPVDPNL